MTQETSVLPGDNPKGNTVPGGGLLQLLAQRQTLGGVTGLGQSGQTEQPKQNDTAPIMTGGPVVAKPDTGIETPPVKPLGLESARPAGQAVQQTGGLLQNTAVQGGQAEYKPVTTEMQANQPTITVPKTAVPDTSYKPVSGNAGAAPTINVPQVTTQPVQYQPVAGSASNSANSGTGSPVQTSFTATPFKSDGYTGVQGATNQNYTPGADSLVENRVAGLLDPNSALMRKAAAEAAQYSASRGLQSSSIGGEVALSTMIDKAMPIASQDANTYNQAQQLGWQQSWQSGENNLGRTHDASMADKQGNLQTNLQNAQMQFQNNENNAGRAQQTELQKLQHQQSLGLLDAQGAQRMQELQSQQQFQAGENNATRQMQAEMQKLQHQQNLGMLDAQGSQRMQELSAQLSFQANESNTNRQFQTELQKLQYQQSLGMLDAQGAQRMQELNAQFGQSNYQMERGNQLQTDRDKLMQQFSNQNMDKQFLQQLETTRIAYEQQDKQFMAQLEAGKQVDYRNAVSTAYNNYLAQVGAIQADPNMTAEQKSAGVTYMQSQLDAHRKSLETLVCSDWRASHRLYNKSADRHQQPNQSSNDHEPGYRGR
ncbi:MAG: hypothetical protein U5L02_06475 [Rheinheimera sp.]|nr:hypothetical protein [Rheinheimera sp.]